MKSPIGIGIRSVNKSQSVVLATCSAIPWVTYTVCLETPRDLEDQVFRKYSPVQGYRLYHMVPLRKDVLDIKSIAREVDVHCLSSPMKTSFRRVGRN